MTRRTTCRTAVGGIFTIAVLSTCVPARAQGTLSAAATVSVKTPGAAFTALTRNVASDDIPAGRRFRGRAAADVIIRARMRLPAPASADLKMQTADFRAGGTEPHWLGRVAPCGYNVVRRWFGGEMDAQVTSYLGLVPRELSSGEHQHRGRILRSAHPHVQSLLIQPAWRMSRSSDAKRAGLRAWADAIAHRRGKKVAMVALARRLARILFAMWRDKTEYQAKRVRVITSTAPAIVDDAAAVV